jgi:3-oxoadipate enol-lactonase
MFVTVNDVRLFCSDRGAADLPPLLLVHGFPLDHTMWAAQSAGLSRTFRVVAPDLRGHGRSDVPVAPYGMDELADDLAALMDRLGIEQAVVGGLSMGGYVALAFWRRHPHRVRALLLADTRAEADSEVARAGRGAAIAKAREKGSAAIADDMLPRLLAPHNLARHEIERRLYNMMAWQPRLGMAGSLAAMRDRPDSRPTLTTITVPTLVIVGDEDAITPAADSEALAEAIPGARLVVIPGAGHMSPMEAPRAFNRAVRAFLAELGS